MSIKSMILKWAGIDPEEIKREAKQQTMDNFALFLGGLDGSKGRFEFDGCGFNVYDSLYYQINLAATYLIEGEGNNTHRQLIAESINDSTALQEKKVANYKKESIDQLLASKDFYDRIVSEINKVQIDNGKR